MLWLLIFDVGVYPQYIYSYKYYIMKIFFTTILLFTTHFVFGQNYVDKITKETCQCASKTPHEAERTQHTVRLGLCMIKAATPYKKQLKRDYDINFGNTTDQKKLGKLVGTRMAELCPDFILSMLSKEPIDAVVNKTDNVDAKNKITSGKIINIENKQFVVFEIQNNSINSSKYFWLGKIQSNIKDFANSYYKLVGAEVEIEYKKIELFDTKINDYRRYKIIQSIRKK